VAASWADHPQPMGGRESSFFYIFLLFFLKNNFFNIFVFILLRVTRVAILLALTWHFTEFVKFFNGI
jgi:hypothetical protein